MGRVTRGSSPVLVGRDDELRRLRDALALARTTDRPVVLLSGEAGIGKSRMLSELESSVTADPPGGRPVRFLHAGCIEVGERLAYLPILDWLAELGATDGADTADVVSEAAALRSAFGGAAAIEVAETADATGLGRGGRFGAARDLLVRVAAEVDVVAIIDDLHWADRSTLDVLAFLARRLGRSGVIIIGAYRSDELHRRHPLTASLVELERHATLDHVRLEPLHPADVARQIAAIKGVQADDGQASRVVELADGNPFHVEELLALDRPGPLPSSLHDVLAARLAQVDDATVGILREAAVIGRRVDGELLAAVSRVDRDTVDASLRTAMDARILVADEDGRRVRFRHALLREAVYDEVLPSDRLALHRRIATCLAERPELGDPTPSTASADLARHWLAAGALSEAFLALLEAGRLAASVAAWAEARWALEEALGLWDRIPDAPLVAGRLRSSVLEEASLVAWYEGASRRALELNRAAQAEPDVRDDQLHLGRLITSQAWYHNDIGEAAAYRATAERAVASFPSDAPSAGRAMALGTLAASIAVEGRMSEALAALTEAQAMATAIGDKSEMAANLAFLAWMHSDRGEERVALSMLEQAGDALRSAEGATKPGTMDDAYFAVTTNAPWVWLVLGHYQRAADVADEALADARRRGVDVGLGVWLLSPRAIAQHNLGRWDDAIATVNDGAAFATVIGPESFLQSTLARIQAGRGDLGAARQSVGRASQGARQGWADEMVAVGLAGAWIELLDDKPREAARILRETITAWPRLDYASLTAEMAWLAAWTSADIVVREGVRHDGDGDVDDLTAYARTSVTALRPDATRREAHEILRWLDLTDAELARRDGRPLPATWESIAERLEAVSNRPAAAIARLREAAAILDVGGEADRAATALRAVLAHTGLMGATGIEERARTIARAARLDLDVALQPSSAPSPAPGDPWGLSEREREVLVLLAEGRTNRQIGEALFISDKTASVHVTHILVKLGVSSRTEAALLAVRAGMAGGDRA